MMKYPTWVKKDADKVKWLESQEKLHLKEIRKLAAGLAIGEEDDFDLDWAIERLPRLIDELKEVRLGIFLLRS